MDDVQSTQDPAQIPPSQPAEQLPPPEQPAMTDDSEESEDSPGSKGRVGLAAGLAGSLTLILVTILGLLGDLGQLVSLTAGQLVAALSFTAVVVLFLVLMASPPAKRTQLAPALALIVLCSALGTFALSREALSREALSRDDGGPAKGADALSAWHREGPPNQPLVIEMGPIDPLPQGSFYLDPLRPGPDAYTGDVTIECTTPGMKETVQNCTGDHVRLYAAEPVGKRSLMGVAAGDAFADAGACDETAGMVAGAGKGVDYQAEYLEIAKGQDYCLRLRGDLHRMVAMRIVSWPTEQPRPIRVVMETTTWVR